MSLPYLQGGLFSLFTDCHVESLLWGYVSRISYTHRLSFLVPGLVGSGMSYLMPMSALECDQPLF